LRGGPALRRRELRMRRGVVPERLLRRGGVQDAGRFGLWRRGRGLRGLRHRGRFVRGRCLSVRDGTFLRRWAALRERGVHVRSDLVPQRLLCGYDLHVAERVSVRHRGSCLCRLRHRSGFVRRRHVPLRRRAGVHARAALPERDLRVRRNLVPCRLLPGQHLPARKQQRRLRHGRGRLRHLRRRGDLHRWIVHLSHGPLLLSVGGSLYP